MKKLPQLVLILALLSLVFMSLSSAAKQRRKLKRKKILVGPKQARLTDGVEEYLLEALYNPAVSDRPELLESLLKAVGRLDVPEEPASQAIPTPGLKKQEAAGLPEKQVVQTSYMVVGDGVEGLVEDVDRADESPRRLDKVELPHKDLDEGVLREKKGITLPDRFPYGVQIVKGQVQTESAPVSTSVAPPPYGSLPHRYHRQPASLYATHTYVDPNQEFDINGLDGDEDLIVGDDSKPSTPSSIESESTTISSLFEAVDLSHLAHKDLSAEDSEENQKRSVLNKTKPSPGDNDPFRPSTLQGFLPSKADNGEDYYARPRQEHLTPDQVELLLRAHGHALPRNPFDPLELRTVPSKPVQSPFGVSVDFAGYPTDNPLYRPSVYTKEVVPDHLRGDTGSEESPVLGSIGGAAHQQWQQSLSSEHTREKKHYYVKSSDYPTRAHSKYVKDIDPKNKVTVFDPYLDTNYAPPVPEQSNSIPNSPPLKQYIQTFPSGPLPQPPPVPKGPIIATSNRQFVTEAAPASPFSLLPNLPTLPAPPSPGDTSLLFLSPEGPKMPILSKLANDMSHMMKSAVHQGSHFGSNFGTSHPGSDEGFMTRMGNVFSKLMGAHYGDRNFDGFDFIPVIAVLVASALIVAGLFPNGLNSFGLTNGNLVINGRKDDQDPLDIALNQLESGVLMISAFRKESGCAERLACRLSEMAKERGLSDDDEDPNLLILDTVEPLLPEKYKSFSSLLRRSLKDGSEESCQAECTRCLEL